MKRARAWLLVGLLWALAPVPGLAGAPDFSGAWETAFGLVHLAQRGAEVRGTYALKSGLATVEGDAQGQVLTFRYREPEAAGEGRFELEADGRSFKGRWRPEGSTEWRPWNGRRADLEAAAEATFAGVWSSTYGRLRLLVDGASARGTYAGGAGGVLEGRLQGRRLTFTYREPEARGEGWFELAPDGRGMTGRWRPAGAVDWLVWDAERVSPRPGESWLVVLEAPWEDGLEEKEYSFGTMLRAFFARAADVNVRHRIFHRAADLRAELREVSFLAEPVVVSVATHGTEEGLAVGGETLGADVVADGLRYAPNVQLLHLSACLTMKEDLPHGILTALGDRATFPVSGYTTSADWAASAVLEFMYFELILERGLEPLQAAEQVQQLFSFAGGRSRPGAAIEALGFTIVAPPSTAARE